MTEIITITTQEELDKLPEKFKTFTRIIIKNDDSKYIHVNKTWDNAHVEASGNAHVEAYGKAHVVAHGKAHVEAYGKAHVEAYGKAHVEASGNAHVVASGNAHVVARDNAHVVAHGKAHVEAYGKAHVEAYGKAHVEASGKAHVKASDNAHVVARDNAHVEAWDNAHVVASGNAHVVASGNAHVVAWGNTAVRLMSKFALVDLFMRSVCWAIANGQVNKKSDSAWVYKPESPKTTNDWISDHCLNKTRHGYITLYKRVSSEFKTQEGKVNETTWTVGSTLEHSSWDPKKSECGEGKFHACSHAYFCDEFRSNTDDRYIAIKVNVKDLFHWPNGNYPHKIAFRKGKVMHECDMYGNPITLD